MTDVSSALTRVLTDTEREFEAVILARLEAKSDHDYQWPRWAAAHEAAQAVGDYLASRETTEETS